MKANKQTVNSASLRFLSLEWASRPPTWSTEATSFNTVVVIVDMIANGLAAAAQAVPYLGHSQVLIGIEPYDVCVFLVGHGAVRTSVHAFEGGC